MRRVGEDPKVNMCGGPVLQYGDRIYRGNRVPRSCWKILAFAEQGRMKSRALLLARGMHTAGGH
jgi:hypothetical protein